MKKILLLSAILYISLGNVLAQGIKFSFRTGYGFYNMKTLKDFTQSYYDDIPFTAKIISNYPPYLFYKPMILYTINKTDIGLSYTFQSTGSRISSKDFSGEYLFDTRIKANSFGLIANYKALEYKSTGFSIRMESGFTYSYLQFDELIKIDTNQSTQQLKAKNNSFYIEPGVNGSYKRGKWELELNISYHTEAFRTDFKSINNPEQKIVVRKGLSNPDNWNSFRIGITVSFSLLKKRNQGYNDNIENL